MATAILLAITVLIAVTFLDLLIFWLFLRKISYADRSITLCLRGNFLYIFSSAAIEESLFRAFLLIFSSANAIYFSANSNSIIIVVAGVLVATLASWQFAKIHFNLGAPTISSYYRVCRNFRKFFWNHYLNGKSISLFDKKQLKGIYSQIRMKVKKDLEQNLFKAFFLLCFCFGMITSMLVLFFGWVGFIAAVIAHALFNYVGVGIRFEPSNKKPFA